VTSPLAALRERLRSGSDGSEAALDPRLLAPMILGSVLNPINSSILAVSLVPIGVAFGAPPSETAWLVSALYLATAIGQPVMGRLIDLYGPRRLYLAGATLTGLAGVVGTVAPGLGVLIAARVLLGFGTCAGYPAAMYLIRSEASRTGRDSPAGALTALAVAGQTTAVIGPSLGGLLIGLGGWRTTLAVNIPLAVAAVYLGLRRLPSMPTPDRDERARPMTALDPVGMVLFAAALVTLLLFLMDASAGLWYLPVLAVAAGVGFVLRELRAPMPFIDLRVLRGNPPLVTTYARALFAYCVAYSFLYGYAQWMQDGRDFSATAAGFALFPLFATGIAISAITGRHREVRAKLVVGATAQLVGSGLMLLLHSDSPIWLLVGLAMVLGVSQGLNGLALQNSVYHQADPARIGSSSGLLRTFVYLGAIVASAATGSFLSDDADTAGLHDLSWFMLVLAIMTLAVTVGDRSLRRVGSDLEP
jgi:MFS family permease